MALGPFGWVNKSAPAINMTNLEKDRREIAAYFETEVERLEKLIEKGGGISPKGWEAPVELAKGEGHEPSATVTTEVSLIVSLEPAEATISRALVVQVDGVNVQGWSAHVQATKSYEEFSFHFFVKPAGTWTLLDFGGNAASMIQVSYQPWT